VKTSTNSPIRSGAGKRNSALAALALVALAELRPALAQNYTITYLGPLGGSNSVAVALNDFGQVTGVSLATNGARSGFLWTPSRPNGLSGSMADIPIIPGGRAGCINNSGQVVGGGYGGDTSATAYLWTPSNPNGPTGTVTALDGPSRLPYVYDVGAINDAGQIVGTTYNIQCGINGCNIGDVDVTLWRSSNPHVIGPGVAWGLNSAGQIVGELSGSAMLWQANGATVLLSREAAADQYAEALAINSAGQVAGSQGLGSTTRSFVWIPSAPNGTSGELTDLGPGFAESINGVGQVVGWVIRDGVPFAWLWQNGTLRDLNALVPANSGWHLEEARGINDAGQIAVSGTNASGQVHALLLTPVVQLRLTAATMLPSGQLHFALTGEAGRSYTIQASTDLVTWAALTNFVSTTGTNQVTDPEAPNLDRRFYRAVTP